MSEEKTIYTITSDRNERVFIHAMPGHFVSSSSHLNFYIGTSDLLIAGTNLLNGNIMIDDINDARKILPRKRN